MNVVALGALRHRVCRQIINALAHRPAVDLTYHLAILSHQASAHRQPPLIGRTDISVRRSSQAFGRCLVRRLSLHSRNGVDPSSV
jgi:hypothetical protein